MMKSNNDKILKLNNDMISTVKQMAVQGSYFQRLQPPNS